MIAFPCGNLSSPVTWKEKAKLLFLSYDGTFVCSLCPYCKFEINLRLHAIWLVHDN